MSWEHRLDAIQEARRYRIAALAPVVGFCALYVMIPPFQTFIDDVSRVIASGEKNAVHAWLSVLGPTAVFGAALLQAVTAIVPPIFADHVTIGIATHFGSLLGTVISVIAVTVGSTYFFVVARVLAEAAAESFFDRSTLGVTHEIAAEVGGIAVFALRLVPWIPAEIISLLAGASRVPILHFSLATALGSTPIFALQAYRGSGAVGDPVVSMLDWLGVAIVVPTVAVILSRARRYA